MKNLLAIPALALAAATVPTLAASSTLAGDDEEQPTMKQLAAKIDALATTLGKANGSETDCTATTPCGLWGRLDNLTTKVDNFAGRGHQVAVVMTIPTTRRLGAAYLPDYYLVGASTIPGFPSETVAANGKFAENVANLPAGTYLFELQQPYSDQPFCHGSISRLHVSAPLAWGDRTSCPRIHIFPTNGGTTGGRQRMEDGFLIYAVTTTTGSFEVKHRFPGPRSFAFTDDRPLNSYRGAVKITKLK